LPLALNGSFTDIPGSRDFREGKSTEVLQVDNLGEGWFDLGEFVKGLADASELIVVNWVLDFCSKRGDLELSTALLGASIPRMVNNQATHHPTGITHESATICEGGPVFAGDFYVGLVKKGNGA